jgi:heavy metal sensor kinase
VRFPVSIRLRLTLWYVVLLAVILAVFIASVYLVQRHLLYKTLDESIQNQASALLDAIQVQRDTPSLQTVAPSSGPEETEHFARVFDASQNVVFDNTAAMGHIPVDAQAVARALAGKSETRRFKVDGDPTRARMFPVRRDGRTVGVLEVGLAEDDVADALDRLLLVMGVAYAATLAVAILGGAFLAGRALAPVDKITMLARRISADRLGQRLDLQLPDDEVGRLASTFDEMIARLDSSFRRQRQFTADASHELRTPLTIMKGQIDVALQKERQPQDYRQVLEAVNDEVDRLIRLTGSLLTLTRADAGEIPLAFESVGVADLVAGAVDQASSMALPRDVDLQLVPGPSVTIRADEGLLLQLLLNLLDNATKYTPRGGRVSVGWGEIGSRVELWVRDNGIGIPADDIAFIFDRFYRVDRARSRSEGGVGLGLAISRWIAEAHDGSIRVESAPDKGSTFTVTLPAVV